MAITVNTNMSSMIAQKSLNQVQNKLSTTLNRLATGLRVNSAKDDAAGLAIAEGMTARIRGLNQAARNGNDGISLIQTAESGMNQVLSLLQRMRELGVQASTGTYQTSDLANLDTEFQSLKNEIDRVANVTDFNGQAVLNGGTVSIQIGSQNTANDRLTITLTDSDSTALAINADDITSNANAQTAITNLDTAITSITTGLAQLGANQSNLESAVSADEDRVMKIESARSRIMDTDFAAESSNLAKYQILQQTGAAMLSQANSSGQIVLGLIQR
ncbi:hypothetical protein EP47_04950 [Legionella norrlandica]|uniref:Flagellin n=1 Tax=Legionella norrlandica TaxID=1498499 RepID=A0A0A2SW83_9GAMM|nr:flagellin [Legionella norrlandica]KGP63714.1 hypothetical protein EP47_04950 [Legionella norrlandica]